METNSKSSCVRIALYGGAFDPVHRAHLAMAQAAYEQANLCKVIFIPSAQSPLKGTQPSSTNEERIEMLRLALDGHDEFKLDLSEIEAGGVSYSIHTVRRMSERYPEVDLFWILGGDQLAQLDQWFAIDELVRLVTFLVVDRPGAKIPATVPGLRVIPIDLPMMPESSTEIRKRLAAGLSVASMLPEDVAAFIDRRGLYKAQM